MKYAVNILPTADLTAVTAALENLVGGDNIAQPHSRMPRYLLVETEIDSAAIDAINGVCNCGDPDEPATLDLLNIVAPAAAQPLDPGKWGLGYISGRDNLALYEWFDGQDGTGVAIYSIDTVANAISEFSGRLTQIYDPYGIPNTQLHGTATMCLAGGDTFGTAKGAALYNAAGFDGNGSGTNGTVVAAGNACIDHFEDFPPAKGAVLFMSLSSTTLFGNPYSAMIDRAKAAGMVVVSSAGNNGFNLNTSSQNVWPAEDQDVLAIGSIDNLSARASFSNYGNALAIYAPGVNNSSLDHNGVEFVASGTSFSAPYVAGVLACAMSAGVADPVAWLLSAALPGVATGTVVGTDAVVHKPNEDLSLTPPPPPVTIHSLPAIIDVATMGNSALVDVTGVDSVSISSYDCTINAAQGTFVTCSPDGVMFYNTTADHYRNQESGSNSAVASVSSMLLDGQANSSNRFEGTLRNLQLNQPAVMRATEMRGKFKWITMLRHTDVITTIKIEHGGGALGVSGKIYVTAT